MPPTQEDFDLADQENHNLRKAVLFCAGFLPTPKLEELRAMLRKPIMEGGAVPDGLDDERDRRETYRLGNLAADMLDAVAGAADPTAYATANGAKMAQCAEKLRHVLGPEPSPTLNSVVLANAELITQ